MRHFAIALAAPFVLAVFACHSAHALEPARSVTPTIDLEISDLAPDKSSHVARFTLAVIDGKAGIKAQDGESRYDLEAREVATPDPRLALVVKRRTERGNADEIDVTSAIPEHPNGRVLVAKIDRTDGRSTSVIAQVR